MRNETKELRTTKRFEVVVLKMVSLVLLRITAMENGLEVTLIEYNAYGIRVRSDIKYS